MSLYSPSNTVATSEMHYLTLFVPTKSVLIVAPPPPVKRSHDYMHPEFCTMVYSEIHRKKTKRSSRSIMPGLQEPVHTERWLDQAVAPDYNAKESRTACLFASVTDSLFETHANLAGVSTARILDDREERRRSRHIFSLDTESVRLPEENVKNQKPLSGNSPRSSQNGYYDTEGLTISYDIKNVSEDLCFPTTCTPRNRVGTKHQTDVSFMRSELATTQAEQRRSERQNNTSINCAQKSENKQQKDRAVATYHESGAAGADHISWSERTIDPRTLSDIVDGPR